METFFVLLLMVIATLLSATGMFFLKRSAATFKLHPIAIAKNWQFLLAGTLYAVSLGLYVIILKFLPISVAYPLTSMNYIWAAGLSAKYLDEKVDVWRWSGIALIVIGIILLAL
jgi:undecaprenyl phosphate-alpha-L-ara4N flippase subunit ArnE